MRAFLPIILLALGTVGSPSQGKPQVDKKLTPKQIFQAYNNSVVTVVTNDGSGSGFFVKNGLLVATCYHVIKGATSIEVEGTKGEKWQVGYVYFDKASDAAILKLTHESGRKPIPVGDFSKLMTGDDLCIIGSPLGLDQSLSTGIVSAKRNDGTADLIQTTAAISPGSSGGPVFNSQGKFVGFVRSHLTEGQSLNLAISSSAIVRLWSSEQIPIARFLLGPNHRPAVPTTPPKSDSEIHSEKVDAAIKRFASYCDRVTKGEIEWQIVFMRWLESPTKDAKANLDQVFRSWKNLDTAILDSKNLTTSHIGLWNSDELNEFRTWQSTFQAVSVELSKMQSDFIKANSKESPNEDELTRIATEVMAKYERQSELRKQLFELRHSDWFIEELFKSKLSPPVCAYVYPPWIHGIFPDTNWDLGCFIGFAPKTLNIPANSKIVQVHTADKERSAKVTSWTDLVKVLNKWHEDGKDFEIIVDYESLIRNGSALVNVTWPKS